MEAKRRKIEDARLLLKEVETVAQQYIDWDFDEKDKDAVTSLLEGGRKEVEDGSAGESLHKLRDIMLERIAFGTAGLRARMAPGYKNMNPLVIAQTSQGLAAYVAATVPYAQQRGVVLGYDGRYNSKDYAEITAAVFRLQGFKVFLFSKLVPTPMVPFGVTHLKASVGVMVTASHNPKDDNGYKVYWGNGAQIIPPQDVGIAECIMKNLKPWQNAFKLSPDDAMVVDPFKTLWDAYFNAIGSQLCWTRAENKKSKLKVTYTAMHGVGTSFVYEAFRRFDLPPLIPTKEQVEPDPEFSTVAFPNPEEGKGSLALALQTADKHESRLVLANDPDADRLAVAEKNPKTGEWYVLNGNEIAALFADWVWTNFHQQNPERDPKECVMIASTVSSKFLQAMAEKEGFLFEDTLTGFKWMANAAQRHIEQGHTFLLAYEVEIGFVVGDMSLDKDGVRTSAVFVELAQRIYDRGDTLVTHLEKLYKKYGYFVMNNSYFFCTENAILDRIFLRLRTANNGSYVTNCGPHKLLGIRDVTKGVDTSREDGKCQLPTMADQQMLTFYLEHGAVATMRNSGTEPKLKFYVETRNPKSKEAAAKECADISKWLIEEFMQPKVNGLTAKKVE